MKDSGAMRDENCTGCGKKVRRCRDCRHFMCHACGRFAYWNRSCNYLMDPEHPPKDKRKVECCDGGAKDLPE